MRNVTDLCNLDAARVRLGEIEALIERLSAEHSRLSPVGAGVAQVFLLTSAVTALEQAEAALVALPAVTRPTTTR